MKVVVGVEQVVSLGLAADDRLVERLADLGGTDQATFLPGEDEEDAVIARDFQDQRMWAATLDHQMATSHYVESVSGPDAAVGQELLVQKMLIETM